MIGMLPENKKRAAIACDDDGPDTGGNVTSLTDAAADCTQDVETFRAWAINAPSAQPLRDALAPVLRAPVTAPVVPDRDRAAL
jgi:hypothetical protein